MAALNFCSLFKKVCTAFWKYAFYRTFCMYFHFVWWPQISSTHDADILLFKYSRDWIYALPKKAKIWQIRPAIDVKPQKTNLHSQKDVKSEVLPIPTKFWFCWTLNPLCKNWFFRTQLINQTCACQPPFCVKSAACSNWQHFLLRGCAQPFFRSFKFFERLLSIS